MTDPDPELLKRGVVIWPPIYSCCNPDGSLRRMDQSRGRDPDSNWGAGAFSTLTRKGVHFGQDFFPQYDREAVHVISGGVVVSIGNDPKGAGRYVVTESVVFDKKGAPHIRYDMYMHLDSIPEGIVQGKQLTAGDIIGNTGRTGSVKGQGMPWDILCMKSFQLSDRLVTRQLRERNATIKSGDWETYAEYSARTFWAGYKAHVAYYKFVVAQQKGEKLDEPEPPKPTLISAKDPHEFVGMPYLSAKAQYPPPKIATLGGEEKPKRTKAAVPM